jgi:hypothetical protein
LNSQLEKRFPLFGYYWALRGGPDDITGRSNPVVVNADINSPQFLTFSGYNRRAVTSRIRSHGRKGSAAGDDISDLPYSAMRR